MFFRHPKGGENAEGGGWGDDKRGVEKYAKDASIQDIGSYFCVDGKSLITHFTSQSSCCHGPREEGTQAPRTGEGNQHMRNEFMHIILLNFNLELTKHS